MCLFRLLQTSCLLPHTQLLHVLPTSQLMMPPLTITVTPPDGDSSPYSSVKLSRPSLNIIPATPISGGGANDAIPFQTWLGNLSGVFWVHCPLTVHEYNYTKPALSDVIIEEKAPLSYLFAPLAYTPQKDVVHTRPGRPGTRVMLKL
ncbi:hypothetical protein JOM56_000239 [Amanita muscaria]